MYMVYCKGKRHEKECVFRCCITKRGTVAEKSLMQGILLFALERNG